jgi:putative transposase
VGRVYKCPKCGFELDRQKLASINIYLKYLRMRGLPHSNDPEKAVKGELWAGVTPSGRSPVTWAPMKGALRAVKPRAEGLISLDIKPNETQTPVVQGIMQALLGI